MSRGDKLKRHYRKNFEAAVEWLDDHLPLEEFCWMALSWRTARMIADIGAAEAAAMFEEWAKLIRKGRFTPSHYRNIHHHLFQDV